MTLLVPHPAVAQGSLKRKHRVGESLGPQPLRKEPRIWEMLCQDVLLEEGARQGAPR